MIVRATLRTLSTLTDAQLAGRLLVQQDKLRPVHVVGPEDGGQLLQPFLAQPLLHVLLRPVSCQPQPAGLAWQPASYREAQQEAIR